MAHADCKRLKTAIRRCHTENCDSLDEILNGDPIVCKGRQTCQHPICVALIYSNNALQRLVDSGWYDLNYIFRRSEDSRPVDLMRSSIFNKNVFAVKLFLERGYKIVIDWAHASLLDLTQEKTYYNEGKYEEEDRKAMHEIAHVLLDHGVLDHEKGDHTRFLFAATLNDDVVTHLLDAGVCPFTQPSDQEIGDCYYDYIRQKMRKTQAPQRADLVKICNHIQIGQSLFSHVLHRRLDGKIN